MPEITIGKALLTATSLFTAGGAYVADWNETHIHNPAWPPHAKFHNAQTMSTGAALGSIGLLALWAGRSAWSPRRLHLATGAASLYWVTQLSAIAYPGTALHDPPRKGVQQVFVANAALGLNAVAFLLERRRLQHQDHRVPRR